MFVLDKTRQLLQAFCPFIGVVNAPSGSDQVHSLWTLFFRQLVNHIPHLVIAAPLHRLACAKDFFNGGSQRFCAINHEQAFPIRWQALVP
jgi:hypothetical protein